MKTIKITFLLALMFVAGISLNSYAQIYIGGKAGVNFSAFTGSDKPDDMKRLPGVNAGIFGTIAINEMFAIQPEAGFEQKGSAAEDATDQMNDFLVHTSDWKWSFDYVTLTVLAKATLGDTRQFSLYAGPYAGILLAANMKGTAEYEHQTDPGESYTEDVDVSVEDNFNNFDYGITMGVGLRIPLNQRFAATGDVRYNHGFAKLDSDDTDKMYNSSIGISLGIAFNLSHY